ncbi:MAG: lipoate--protein ligase family protein [Porphyromonas sp.]|nr:lipoate--protein ligase family protein [Porphyromonas sp.]
MPQKFSLFQFAILRGLEPPLILALEEWLVKHSDTNIILLWQTHPSVVLGKYQSVERETRRDLLEQQGVSLYRRFTGGGAVFTDAGNMNISVIGSSEAFSFDDAVQLQLSFLRHLQVDAGADDRRSLFIGDRKISGSAQAVYKQRQIYHATLLVETDLEKLNEMLQPENTDSESPLRLSVQSHRSPVTNIYTISGNGYSIPEIETHYQVFLSGLGCMETDLNALLKKSDLLKLANEKYQNRSWVLFGTKGQNEIKNR